MIKKYLSLALAISLSLGAWAKTVTPDDALARAQADLHAASTRLPAKVKALKTPVYTARTTDGAPSIYVFSDKNGGYMLLAADDVAYPILGYADKGEFSADKMAPAMRWWLDEYSRQIEWARKNGIDAPAKKAAVEGRRDVAPMIKTHWDQGNPYNLLCPVVNGKRGYTGCVATSMAQIMNYFKYPACGKGKITYSDDEGCGKRLTWDFSRHPFMWDQMLDTYIEGEYTSDEAAAVATLMKSTGASVRMSYSADASGALSIMTASALVKYFDYDPNVDYQIRSYFAATQWNKMLYENIANVGPVLYGGASMLGGGHSFVVDGYQADTDMFHFNWGWGELSDGYFSMDALNPGSLGTGGGNGGGYNFTQDAVFGIQPPTGKPVEIRAMQMSQQGNIGGTITDGKLTLDIVDDAQAQWINYNPVDIDIIMGLSYEKEGASIADADTTVAALSPNIAIPAGYGLSARSCKELDLARLGLADGTYKFTVVSLITNRQDQNWQDRKSVV